MTAPRLSRRLILLGIRFALPVFAAPVENSLTFTTGVFRTGEGVDCYDFDAQQWNELRGGVRLIHAPPLRD